MVLRRVFKNIGARAFDGSLRYFDNDFNSSTQELQEVIKDDLIL